MGGWSWILFSCITGPVGIHNIIQSPIDKNEHASKSVTNFTIPLRTLFWTDILTRGVVAVEWDFWVGLS